MFCKDDSISHYDLLFSRNVFPHSTFNWVGIDGTQVLCHMTPVGECKSLLETFPY
jgi:hypothetical protein